MAGYDGSLNFDTQVNTAGFAKGTQNIKSMAGGLIKSFSKLGAAIGVAFGVKQLISFGKEAVDLASDLKEVQNVVDTAFSSMSNKMEEFAKTSLETYGLSELTAKSMASTYAAMASGMGQTLDAATDGALDMTARLADIMSFYNKSAEEANTIGRAVMSGETEPLKAIGVIMTQAELNVFAAKKGYDKLYDSMSAAEKLSVRQAFFLEKTNLAAGDFEKTSASWANQTKVLTEQWSKFKTIIGGWLINTFTPTLQNINQLFSTLITRAEETGKVLSRVFGWEQEAESAEKAAGAIEDVADATADANKEKKKGSTAGFDQLNLIDGAESGEVGTNQDIAESASAAGEETDDLNNKLKNEEVQLSKLEIMIARVTLVLGGLTTQFKKSFIFDDIQTKMEIFIIKIKGLGIKIQRAFPKEDITENIKLHLGQFLDYIINDFYPLFSEYGTFIEDVFYGISDSAIKAFSDIYDSAFAPFMTTLLGTILPMFTQFGTEAYSTFDTLFTEIKKLFDMIWAEAIKPAMSTAMYIWDSFWSTVKAFWNEYGQPIFDGIKEAIETTSELVEYYWETYLKPIVDKAIESAEEIWDEALQPLLAKVGSFIGELITGALKIYNQFIAPVIRWFLTYIAPVISTVFKGIIEVFKNVVITIGKYLGIVVDFWKGVIKFIVSVFTGDWEGAWNAIKGIFSDVFDGIVDVGKSALNTICSVVEKIINALVSGVNTVIGLLNKINIDMPDWVEDLTGMGSFGFSLSPIPELHIPRLATGMYVPPNYGEFLSILGDSREPEVVSPVSAIKKAVKDAFAELDISDGSITVVVEMDGDVVVKKMVQKSREHKKRTGEPLFE